MRVKGDKATAVDNLFTAELLTGERQVHNLRMDGAVCLGSCNGLDRFHGDNDGNKGMQGAALHTLPQSPIYAILPSRLPPTMSNDLTPAAHIADHTCPNGSLKLKPHSSFLHLQRQVPI